LALWGAALAFAWLIVLPAVARTHAVSEAIHRNETLGLNPSAKFYSELPAMPRVNRRVQAIVAQNRSAFWHASPQKTP
jgi:hypothetical protein